MKGLLYIVIFTLLLTSCVEEDSPLEYMQFNSYELGFLYYPFDTLTYIGNNIECQDTVPFLINKKDTINANVITTFFHWQEPWAFSLKYPVRGTSKLYFEKTCGISYLSFSITKKYGESVGYIYSDLKINNRYSLVST